MLHGKIPYQNNVAIYTHIWKTYVVNGGTIIINDTMKDVWPILLLHMCLFNGFSSI